jgi:hypothetical protein
LGVGASCARLVVGQEEDEGDSGVDCVWMRESKSNFRMKKERGSRGCRRRVRGRREIIRDRAFCILTFDQS